MAARCQRRFRTAPAQARRTVAAFYATTDLDTMVTRAVTIAEIRYGILLIADIARRTTYEIWLESTVRKAFAGRILDLDEHVLVAWRIMLEECRRSGVMISSPDPLIAATAKQSALTVVSRDVVPFVQAGVPVFDPWTGASHPAR